MQHVRKAVIPVGGLGTRFLPATKAVPKEMLTVINKPVIQYAYEEALAAGIEQIIFITGRNKSVISNHFDHAYELEHTLEEAGKTQQLQEVQEWVPAPGNISFIRQQKALGLGHAIWCARHAVGGEPFAVLLPDDVFLCNTPCMKQLIQQYEHVPGSNLVAAMDLPREETRKYGVLDIESSEGRLTKARSVVEKPAPEDAPSTLCISGRYVLQPGIFDILETQERGAGNEIQITDAINTMIASTPTYGVSIEGERFDCGNRLGFLEANLAHALADPDMKDHVLSFLERYQS